MKKLSAWYPRITLKPERLSSYIAFMRLSCSCPFLLLRRTLSLILAVRNVVSGNAMQETSVSNGLIISSATKKTMIWNGSLEKTRRLFLMALFTSCMSALSRVIRSPVRWVV